MYNLTDKEKNKVYYRALKEFEPFRNMSLSDIKRMIRIIKKIK